MENNKKSLDQILTENKLQVFKKIQYENILGFVFENIKTRSLPSRAYYLIAILGFIILVTESIVLLSNGDLHIKEFLLFFIIGIISGSLIVIPFHELFHAIAYKIVGAPKIHFGMDLKQMIFYVAADRFIIGAKNFFIVAISPFAIINALTIVFLSIFNSPQLVIGGLTFLFLHNLMCIGDFAMLSFFHNNRNKYLCTFDILEKKQSYICERIIN